MIWCCLIVIGILIVILIYEIMRDKQRTKELKYVTEKLEEIIQQQTRERVQLVTGDKEIRRLTVIINQLLDENGRNLRGYLRSQESMKKMLSNVSHDLKTPLTVILGHLELLHLKENTEQVNLIYQKVQAVLGMMNEFFDLAKLESKDKVYPKEKVNLTELCRQTVLQFYGELTKNHAKVELTIPEEEIFLQSNPEALQRILNNLISNALKYGMDGRYFGFCLKMVEDKAVIQVIDHGKGIEEKHQEQVFERLYTMEDSRSAEYSGSGLGLSITKALVELLGGTIQLTSEPYKMTIFEVQLKK